MNIIEELDKEQVAKLSKGKDIPDFEQFWGDFHTYVRLQHATGQTEAEILAPVEATLSYDIAGWLADGDPCDPVPYRLPEPTRFIFELTDEGRAELQSSLAVWTTHIRGLSKLVTRVKVESQVRHCRPVDPAAAFPAHLASRKNLRGDVPADAGRRETNRWSRANANRRPDAWRNQFRILVRKSRA